MDKLIQLVQNTSLGSALGGMVAVLIFLSIFIEITPAIKWNPLTSLFKWIGKIANREVVTKVDSLQKKISKMEQDNARRSAIYCRVRILTFGDEIRQNIKHSEENFNQVIEDIDNYQEYCKNHPEFKNNKTTLTTKKILETYKQCMDTNDFL